MTDLKMRALTRTERDVMFIGSTTTRIDLRPYVAAVAQMRAEQAYAIALNGVSKSATKQRFNKAAKQCDRRLRWARMPKDATEMGVELAA